MPAVADTSAPLSRPVNLSSSRKVRQNTSHNVSTASAREASSASVKQQAVSTAAKPAPSSPAGGSASAAAATTAAAAASATSTASVSRDTPDSRESRTPSRRTYNSLVPLLRSSSWSGKPPYPPATRPRVSALPLTAPPRPVGRGQSVSTTSDEPTLDGFRARTFSERSVTNFHTNDGAALSNKDELDIALGDKSKFAEREQPNFPSRDGRVFNPVPRRTGVGMQQNTGVVNAFESQMEHPNPRDQSQTRPLSDHHVHMKFSSSWLTADAKVKAEGEAKTKAKSTAAVIAKVEVMKDPQMADDKVAPLRTVSWVVNNMNGGISLTMPPKPGATAEKRRFMTVQENTYNPETENRYKLQEAFHKQEQTVSREQDQRRKTMSLERSHLVPASDHCKVEPEAAVSAPSPMPVDNTTNGVIHRNGNKSGGLGNVTKNERKLETRSSRQATTSRNDCTDGGIENLIRNDNERGNERTNNAIAVDNRHIPSQTRRRRKQQLQVRGTEPIPSPSKIAVSQKSCTSSTPKAKSNPKVASGQHPQRRLPTRNQAASSQRNESSNSNTAAAKPKRGRPRRETDGRFRKLAPKDVLPQRYTRSYVAAANAVAMLPVSGGLTSFDRLLMTSSFTHVPPTQAPDPVGSRSRLATVGSRSMGQLWSAWGGAVDPPTKKTDVELVEVQPAVRNPKETGVLKVSSLATRANLRPESGAGTTKGSSEIVEKRYSWKPRTHVSDDHFQAHEEDKYSLKSTEDISAASSETQVVKLHQDISPTETAEELWQALEKIDTDTEIDNLTPPPVTNSAQEVSTITSNTNEEELENLVIPPSQKPTASLEVPEGSKERKPAITMVTSTPTMSKSTLSPTSLSTPAKTRNTALEQSTSRPDWSRNPTSEPTLASSKATSCATKTPTPLSASWLTPTTTRTVSYGQASVQKPSPQKTLMFSPSASPQKQPSAVHFWYRCLFCETRFEFAEQHIDHLAHCGAPLTGARLTCGML